MKLAIHNRPGSFSDRWILFCIERNIPYKLVNCNDSDIIQQVKDCDGLMWHWSHSDYQAQNFARQLIFSIEQMGIKVFPDFKTCWHFDDKVGQKYLFEAIKAPVVPITIFYDKKAAYKWIVDASFPKVFKLRGGAGSNNVKLVNNKSDASKFIRKSFRSGFPLIGKFSDIDQRFWVLKRDKNLKAILHFIKGLGRLIIPVNAVALLPRQKGYIYFQDFVAKNSFDDRIVIIGERAIAIRRRNREKDFRASGSGLITHDPEQFPKETIRIAFEVAEKVSTQSLAFDFLYDSKNTPLIVEISYCYSMGIAYDNCPGFWDKDLNWHPDHVNPQRYIIEDFIKNVALRNSSK